MFYLCIHPETVFWRTEEVLQIPCLIREANDQVSSAGSSPKLAIPALPQADSWVSVEQYSIIQRYQAEFGPGSAVRAN